MTNDAQPATSAEPAIDPFRPDPSGPVSFSSGWSLSRFARRSEAGALVGTVGMFIFFAIFGGADFLAVGGFASWLNVASELGIVALPVGLLMIAGELDLSVGSVLAASSVTCAIVSGHYNAPPFIGVLAGLASSTA
jgi:simple sugar transport system permease protein